MGLLKGADRSAVQGRVPAPLSVIYSWTDAQDGLDHVFSTPPLSPIRQPVSLASGPSGTFSQQPLFQAGLAQCARLP